MNFIKDLIRFTETADTEKIISNYEKGYITFGETLSCLLDEYNNSEKVYNIMYKKAGSKGRYKLLCDTEYSFREIWSELTRLKDDHSGYRFKAYEKIS